MLLLVVILVIYINIEIGKKMLNVRLADDHLYGQWLFTWLSLMMHLIVSFNAIPIPTRCLG